MPDLLEMIAENNASVLNGWGEEFRALPETERDRELLTLAREFSRRASWAVDTAEGWLAELKARLRNGMGGDKLRMLLQSGRTLCGMGRTVVEIASDLWRLYGDPSSECLSAISQRLATVEAEIDKLARLARPPSAEELEKLFRRAEEQVQQGASLTLEQALAAVRKSE